MKRSILTAFLIITTFPFLLTAQNEKKYKITTNVEKEYINLEINEWKEINNEWFYMDKMTGDFPKYHIGKSVRKASTNVRITDNL